MIKSAPSELTRYPTRLSEQLRISGWQRNLAQWIAAEMVSTAG
jgi:hypothetical protein